MREYGEKRVGEEKWGVGKSNATAYCAIPLMNVNNRGNNAQLTISDQLSTMLLCSPGFFFSFFLSWILKS